jgi:penicillin-binding protein 1A
MKPEDKVTDKQQCFGGYCPRNFGNKYRGVVPLWVALQQSLNTVSVSLLKQLGFDKVIATAKSLGITRELGRFYPLAVGATEQTVLDMTAAYAAIFNRGVYVTPTPFEEILGPNGELLWSRRVDGDRGRRAVPSDIADAMVWMLQQVVKGGTGYGAVPPNRPAAGKTGTSEGGRDLWFIGGIPQLVTGLWLGYDNNTETKSTSAVAVVAWADYMGPILKDLPVRSFPPKPQLVGKFDPLQGLKIRKTEPKQKSQAEQTSAPSEPLANPQLTDDAPALPAAPSGGTAEATKTPSPLPQPAPSPPPPLTPPPPLP